MKRMLVAVCVMCSVVAACKKKESTPSATGSGSAVATGSGSASEPAKPAPTGKPDFVNVDGRLGKCEFVGFEGTGKDRKAMFKITPPAGKEVETVQTWEFYYDKSGKFLKRYPASTFIEAGPQKLGYTGDDIPKETDTVECELTTFWYKDKSVWFNENIVLDGEDRPKGGIPDAELKKHAGEKVEIELVDVKAGKVKLKNVADKPTKELDVNVLYRLADGKTKYESKSVDVEIAPGATVEQVVELKEVPADLKSAEAYAPWVKFADDTEFTNRNLSGSYR
jgi:uncharacterized cupredoxin-like copper-binding protein